MNMLEGWKTIIVAALTVFAGIAAKAGFTLPETFVLDTAETMIALGGVFAALRVATKTKVGGGK